MSTQVGNQDIIWGIADTATLGFFESLEYDDEGEIKEVPNGDGAIIAAIFHGDKINVKGTYVLDSTKAVPQRGSVVVISQGVTPGPTVGDIYVTKVTQSFSNSDVVKVSLEGTNWPDLVAAP